MFTEINKEELKTKGYTVVPEVLKPKEADAYRSLYDDWLAEFEGAWPPTTKSLIQKFRIGHMEPTWAVRLKAKTVFAEIWGTKKLLTSFDGIAIGRPPEDGQEEFFAPGQDWLHCDQSWEREGFHGYQGAVYLEECSQGDWTFEVIEGSHHYFDSYYEKCPRALKQRRSNPSWRVRNYDLEDVGWFKEQGCHRKSVPVPKGGMVIWDSRLIHANTRPLIRRENPGRWRFVVFVAMAPAVWANEDSLQKKRKAYNQLLMTKHWPCDNISYFRDRAPNFKEMSIRLITGLPPSAKTPEAKLLAGVDRYNPEPEDEHYLAIKPRWRERPKQGPTSLSEVLANCSLETNAG